MSDTPRTDACRDHHVWDVDKLIALCRELERLPGPKQPAVDALKRVLDEIEDYLDQRLDVRDGSDGVQLPNTEMSLLAELRWWRDSAGMNSSDATGSEGSK